MVMKRIPGTSRVVFLPAHCGDHVFDLGQYPEVDDSVKQESVPVVGSWEDYTGSGTKHAQEVAMQGIANELQFDLLARTEDDAHLGEFDARGQPAATHRSRDKLVTLEV